MNSEIHISSLVVHCAPENLIAVKKQLESLGINLEFHGEQAAGKLVIVIETDGKRSLMTAIDSINAVHGVLNAAMIYHQIGTAEEFDQDAELPEDFAFPEHITQDIHTNNSNPNETVGFYAAGETL